MYVAMLVLLCACGGGTTTGEDTAGDAAGGPPKQHAAQTDEQDLADGIGERQEPPGATGSEDDQPGRADAEVEAPSLQAYLDADTRHGFMTLTTTYEDDDLARSQTGELWLDGDRFRYDLYEDDQLLRSILSPDGELAYFVEHAEQRSMPSNATVESYLRRFLPPPVAAEPDGIDEETGLQRLRYVVQETYHLEGAPNPWHAEDLVFLLDDDGRVRGIVSQGWVPRDDGSRSTTVTTRLEFSSLKVQEALDPALFELAYPVG